VKLPGKHNIENLLAAFAAVQRWCSVDSMRSVATTFTGVEHRIEFVREVDGIKFYNDSIASSPTRTIAGLNSFTHKVILIAGGYDKKIPFDKLAEVGVDKVKLLILIGTTAGKIEDAVIKVMERKGVIVPIIKASSLEDAVNIGRDKGMPGDIITLSPACASFDMFKNFEVRGNKFKEIVNNL
jgi:UDP-N-acetylmuramoylalanine--D-glutamate ligase